jgi:thiol:disulfide interchange protein DsbC
MATVFTSFTAAAMRHALLTLAALGVTGVHAAGFAAQAPVTGSAPVASASRGPAAADKDLEAVAATLRAQNPGTRIDSVQRSPVGGLYEVVMGRNVAYMDASGRYALFGHVWDMQARRDLTADRKLQLDRIDTRQLDTSLAMKWVKGRGSRTLFIFSDPQCGFCKQQEQALTALDDVTVYTFVLPILGPESKRLAQAIACAAEPQAAWLAWMLKGQAPAATSICPGGGPSSAGVEQLATALGITGTPTLVAEDGRKVAGAMAAAQLNVWLDAGGQVASATEAAAAGRAPAASKP